MFPERLTSNDTPVRLLPIASAWWSQSMDNDLAQASDSTRRDVTGT